MTIVFNGITGGTVPSVYDDSSTTVWRSWTSTYINGVEYRNAGSGGTATAVVTGNSSSTDAGLVVWRRWVGHNGLMREEVQRTVPGSHLQFVALPQAAGGMGDREHAERLQRQQQAIEEARRREQERSERLAKEKEEAKKRAEKLLEDNLDETQRDQLKRLNSFKLETMQKDGSRRRYVIARGRSRNITEVNESGRPIRILCAHPHEDVPDADTMLAQKLWLEHAEEEFLRVANKQELRVA